MSPELYVIAGPNGIGKTTSSFDLVPLGIPIINSDEIAATVRSTGVIHTNAQEYSNREATRLMNFHIPDHLQLFDNSKSLQLVAEIKKGEVQQSHAVLPGWIADNLYGHFRQDEIKKEKKVVDMNSIEEVRKNYQKFKKMTSEGPGKKTEANQDDSKRSQKKSKGKRPGF